MSEDGDFYMSEDDDQMDENEYDFEYEDDDEEEDGNEEDDLNVKIENTYYAAKSLKEDDPKQAILEFQSIPSMEQHPTTWSFKALKQLIKTAFQIKDFVTVLSNLSKLLQMTQNVTKNYAEKSISNLIDFVQFNGDVTREDLMFMLKFYACIKVCGFVQDEPNVRLLNKTELKMAHTYLNMKNYKDLEFILQSLKERMGLDKEQKKAVSDDQSLDPSTFTPTSFDNQRQVAVQLEILSIQMQMYVQLKNQKQLRELHAKSQKLFQTAIVHPKMIGIIKECCGKMYLYSKEWDFAKDQFFEAFKSFDESGDQNGRIRNLKYLMVCTMLTSSDIDPFDSQELRPWKDCQQDGLDVMYKLTQSFQTHDLYAFQILVSDNRQLLLTDELLGQYMIDILSKIRIKIISQIIKPYSQINLEDIRIQLGGNVTVDEVEMLCCKLIMNEGYEAKIDMKTKILTRNSVNSSNKTQTSLQIEQLSESILKLGENSFLRV